MAKSSISMYQVRGRRKIVPIQVARITKRDIYLADSPDFRESRSAYRVFEDYQSAVNSIIQDELKQINKRIGDVKENIKLIEEGQEVIKKIVNKGTE